MFQLVVNVDLLREINEHKLITAYAHFMYEDESDVTDNIKIKENLTKLLDWDINGNNGLEVYCGKFESIKDKDWERLIKFVQENRYEIKRLASATIKQKKLESIKVINSQLEAKEKHNIERFTDSSYTVSGRGKKAKSCTYNGREYKSRQECMYKEKLTKFQLYTYLKKTNQV